MAQPRNGRKPGRTVLEKRRAKHARRAERASERNRTQALRDAPAS